MMSPTPRLKTCGKKYRKIREVELNDVVMFSETDSDSEPEYAKNNSGVDV